MPMPLPFVARLSFISLTIAFAMGFSDAGIGCCGSSAKERYEQRARAEEHWRREQAKKADGGDVLAVKDSSAD